MAESTGPMAAAMAAGACYIAAKAASKAVKKAAQTTSDSTQVDYRLVDSAGNSLTIAESFCLLWKDPKSGDMAGRQVDVGMQGMVITALLLDLILSGRLVLHSEESKTMGFTKEKSTVLLGDVQSPLPESSAFLQDFLQIFISYHAKHNKPKTLNSWVQDLLMGWKSKPQKQINLITSSLTAKGIVRQVNVWYGKKFPTNDPAAENAVKDKLRAVLLDGAEPDLFSVALLSVATSADKIRGPFSRPFLGSTFSKEELKSCASRMKEIKASLESTEPECT